MKGIDTGGYNYVNKRKSDGQRLYHRIQEHPERSEKEALDRFHSWTDGSMDPAEEELYTNAVKECAGKLKKDSISA